MKKRSFSVKGALLLVVILRSGVIYADEPVPEQKGPSLFSYALYAWHAGFSYYCLYQLACLSNVYIQSHLNQYNEHDFFADTSSDCFSTGHLSAACQEALALYSRQDFSDMINTLLQEAGSRSQAEQKRVYSAIFTQFNFYQFPAFVEALELLPEFHCYILEISYLLRDPVFALKVKYLQGFPPREGFRTFVIGLVLKTYKIPAEKFFEIDDIVDELLNK